MSTVLYHIINFHMQGVNKDVSFATIGLIIGISPLTVAILSPLYGRIVSELHTQQTCLVYI